ncbi:Thiolase [mine drainage metagenome]|uniref:Thiolase n=1 Tax=mine drainage metagenome TaxID=410659 RepID=T0ZES4_9ZZZZ
MNEVYVVSAKRTPIGKYGKSLRSVKSNDLGARSIRSAINSSGIAYEAIDEIIVGNVIQAGNGQNLAGQCATLAGLPETVTKYTVNLVCASGMLAVESGSREIMLGEKDIIVARGSGKHEQFSISVRFCILDGELSI